MIRAMIEAVGDVPSMIPPNDGDFMTINFNLLPVLYSTLRASELLSFPPKLNQPHGKREQKGDGLCRTAPIRPFLDAGRILRTCRNILRIVVLYLRYGTVTALRRN